jgi:DNA-binding NarL/FixJ family response regulator
VADRIRVAIADDHAVVRQGLRTFLEVQPDVEVVGEAVDGAEAVRQVTDLDPDVLLLDLQMPGVDGLTALRQIVESGARTRILVLTSFTDDSHARAAVAAGAAGYLYKDVEPTALAQAIRAVHAGQVLLHPEVAAALSRPAVQDALTPRERDVLAALARGMSNREIARELGVAEKTVKTHVSSILAKLHVADRTQAALLAARADR